MNIFDKYEQQSQQKNVSMNNVFNKYDGGFQKFQQLQKTAKLAEEAGVAVKEAKEANSLKGLIKQTIKELPAAAKKVFSRKGLFSIGGAKSIASGLFKGAVVEPISGIGNIVMTTLNVPNETRERYNLVKKYEELTKRKQTSEQKALEEGFSMAGLVAPYEATAKGAIKTLEILNKGEKLGIWGKRAADYLGWIGAGQILHDEQDGSRAQQLISDTALFGLFSVGGAGIKMLKNTLEPASKKAMEEVGKIMQPVVKRLKRGEKIPLIDIEKEVNKARAITRGLTSKEPTEIVEKELLPKLTEVEKKNIAAQKIETYLKEGKTPPKNLVKQAKAKTIKSIEKSVIEQQIVNEAKKYKSAEEFYQKMSNETLKKFRVLDIRGKEQIKKWFNENVITKEPILDTLNPTGSLFIDYKPQERMKMKLGKNITTLDKTSGKSPDTIITIYRGAPKIQKQINPGDFVTTNYDIAKSYIGEDGHILSKKVKMKDVLDDLTEPLGEEYIYRPQNSSTKTLKQVKSKPKIKEIKVPFSQVPVGEAKTKISRLEQRVKEMLKDTPDNIKNLSTYQQMNKKEQIKKAIEYVSKNESEAIEVLLGDKEPPKGLLKNSIYIAMMEKASKDTDLALKLASLNATRAGQEISILTEVNKHTPVKYLTEIQQRNIKIIGGLEKVKEYKNKLVKQGEKIIKKNYLKKDEWLSFIEEIKC